jgi:hypothetical protein
MDRSAAADAICTLSYPGQLGGWVPRLAYTALLNFSISARLLNSERIFVKPEMQRIAIGAQDTRFLSPCWISVNCS